MITKAFILGAGLGTRLRPLTNVRPKPLVPLFHKPMMMYAMDRALDLGLKEISINTHHLAPVWEEFFPTSESQSYEGLNGLASRPSTYLEAAVSLFQEDDLLETGGGIKNIENWVGDDDALVYNGDIYCSIPLQPLVDLHNTGQFEATLVLRSDGPAKHLAIEGDQVIDIRNSLGRSEGTHQFTGIYAISPKILARLEANKKESVIRAFIELAEEGRLGAVVIDEGEWFDLGTREMYLEAHQSESMTPTGVSPIAGSTTVPRSSEICSSWIGEEVSVAENVKIENSVVWGGVSIGEGAKITNSVIFSDVPAHAVLDSVDQ